VAFAHGYRRACAVVLRQVLDWIEENLAQPLLLAIWRRRRR
jgi:hypothetical protein